MKIQAKRGKVAHYLILDFDEHPVENTTAVLTDGVKRVNCVVVGGANVQLSDDEFSQFDVEFLTLEVGDKSILVEIV